MTNYNDGKWHGWNGGECPVHEETIVEIMTAHGPNTGAACKQEPWGHSDDGSVPIVAFRVIREHREPREFWIVRTDFSPQIYSSKELAQEYASKHGFDAIHVREVIEE